MSNNNKEKTKTEKYRENKRTFSLTDHNLIAIEYVTSLILSERNITKLINFAVEKTFGEWSRIFEAEVITPKQQDNLIFKLSKEISDYAKSEEIFR